MNRLEFFKRRREIIQYAKENGSIWNYTKDGDKNDLYIFGQLVKDATLTIDRVDEKKGITFYTFNDH